MSGKTSGGVLLIVAGTWVLAQVLAGKALQRLGLLQAVGVDMPDPVTAPDKGYNNVPHDGRGNPL